MFLPIYHPILILAETAQAANCCYSKNATTFTKSRNFNRNQTFHMRAKDFLT